jgi:porin
VNAKESACSLLFHGTVSLRVTLPLRNYELVVELAYQALVVDGWTIQPDFQYIFHPGGGVIDPINPFIGRIPDAAVFALRTAISF